MTTQAEIRRLVANEFAEAVRLRYTLDEALERTADAVFPLTKPGLTGQAYTSLLHEYEVLESDFLHAEDVIDSLQSEIQTLRTRLDHLNY